VTVHRLAADLPYELPVNLRAPAGVRQVLDRPAQRVTPSRRRTCTPAS